MVSDRDKDSNDDLISDEDMQPSMEDEDDEETLDFISDDDRERKAGASNGSVAYTVLDRDRLVSLQVRICAEPC